MMNKQELLAFMEAILNKYESLELKQFYDFEVKFSENNGDQFKLIDTKQGIEFGIKNIGKDYDSFECDLEQLLGEIDICLPSNSIFKHNIELENGEYLAFIRIYTKNEGYDG